MPKARAAYRAERNGRHIAGTAREGRRGRGCGEGDGGEVTGKGRAVPATPIGIPLARNACGSSRSRGSLRSSAGSRRAPCPAPRGVPAQHHGRPGPGRAGRVVGRPARRRGPCSGPRPGVRGRGAALARPASGEEDRAATSVLAPCSFPAAGPLPGPLPGEGLSLLPGGGPLRRALSPATRRARRLRGPLGPPPHRWPPVLSAPGRRGSWGPAFLFTGCATGEIPGCTARREPRQACKKIP